MNCLNLILIPTWIQVIVEFSSLLDTEEISVSSFGKMFTRNRELESSFSCTGSLIFEESWKSEICCWNLCIWRRGLALEWHDLEEGRLE